MAGKKLVRARRMEYYCERQVGVRVDSQEESGQCGGHVNSVLPSHQGTKPAINQMHTMWEPAWLLLHYALHAVELSCCTPVTSISNRIFCTYKSSCRHSFQREIWHGGASHNNPYTKGTQCTLQMESNYNMALLSPCESQQSLHWEASTLGKYLTVIQ